MGLFDSRKVQLNDAGVRLLNQRRFLEAARYFDEALRIDPNMVQPHLNLSLVYTQTGNWDLAIAEAKEAIRLQPDNCMAHNNLGIAYLEKANRLKDIPSAELSVREFRVALSFNPNYHLADSNLRRARYLRDELERQKQSQVGVGEPGQNATVIIKEIVKVPCSYCETLFDITVNNCPSCGAPRSH